jgi:tetratricopeptide (TPR) repeat protein
VVSKRWRGIKVFPGNLRKGCGVICICLIVLAITGTVSLAQDKTLKQYIEEAENYQKSDKPDQAAKVMEEAIGKYPDNSTAHSYFGLYLGMQAGRTTDFMEAGRLVGKAFEMLDKAVSLDPQNPIARYHRGVLSVNVPKFLGKMETGIQDLGSLIETPDKVSEDILVSACEQLAQVYEKEEEREKAKLAWEKVIELAPGTDLAKKAEKSIAKLSEEKQPQPGKQPDSAAIASLKQRVEKEPDNPALLLELGKAYADARDFQEAEKALKEVVRIDPASLEAYKQLASVLGELAGEGYDERIYEDTDLRTNLAFEVMNVLDKTVELAPEDVEARLSRGIVGVNMPFFVGKLDQAMDDLNWVIKSDAPDSVKADALYWLGAGYQKKAMTQWIKVVSDYPDSQASRTVFETMRPAIKRLDVSKYQLPILTIDFVLGFRDELPPQTVVWVEDKGGQFVKTIYVSGFSGHAKEQQVNLPEWSDSSEFADADAVTSASIDVGHHIYVWDLKDSSGKQIKPGEYVIRVEVHYWPSMEYQMVSATVKLGETGERAVVEEGSLIPYLEVRYFPEGGK